MSALAPFAESAVSAFDAVRESGPSWLREKRTASFETFKEKGLPTVREESWRQTDLTPLSKRALAVPATGNIDGFALAASLDAWRLVFVNGHFDEAASELSDLPEGLRVMRLATALSEGDRVAEEFLGCIDPRDTHSLIALNSAMATDGAFVEIAHGVTVDRPLLIEYRSAANAADAITHPRNLIVAGKNSALRVVEIYSGADDAAYVTNAVTEAETAEGAEIHHARIQAEGNAATHLGFIAARTATKGNFRTHAINVGAALARQEIYVHLGGENSECTLNGMYCGRDRQVTDTHTIIDHAVPNCESYQLYKGILDDKSRAVFGGRILVREDAQKTDAYQTNRALLLSDDARALAKPQLEIYADDVKCSHGSTIGQLNEEQLFYLRARGIPFEQARRILLHAFTLEALTGAEPEAVQEWGDKLVHELFG